MLVMNINITTDIVKYVFNKNPAVFQFLYTQLAVTSFPTSNTDPIISIGMADAENIDINPIMENHAAVPAIANAVNRVIKVKNIYYLCYKMPFSLSTVASSAQIV